MSLVRRYLAYIERMNQRQRPQPGLWALGAPFYLAFAALPLWEFHLERTSRYVHFPFASALILLLVIEVPVVFVVTMYTWRAVMDRRRRQAYQASPQPAWHPDPSGTTQLRWWDGTTWTADTIPYPSERELRNRRFQRVVVGLVALAVVGAFSWQLTHPHVLHVHPIGTQHQPIVTHTVSLHWTVLVSLMDGSLLVVAVTLTVRRRHRTDANH